MQLSCAVETCGGDGGRWRYTRPGMSRLFTSRVVSWWALVLVVMAGCGNKPSPGVPRRDPEVVRYRLLLRENPVDSAEAFRCYGACQEHDTPTGYVRCLEECPGFDITPGITCAGHEVPPAAACFTARKVSADDEIPPGYIVLSVMASVAVVVALASVCNSTASPNSCGYYGYPLPPY